MIPPEKQNRPRYKSFYPGLGVVFKEKQIPYQPEFEWRPKTANIFGRPNLYRNMVPDHLLERPLIENESELEFCSDKPITEFSVQFIPIADLTHLHEKKNTTLRYCSKSTKRANTELHRFPICLILPQIVPFLFTNKHNKNLKYVMYLNKAELSTEAE